MDRQEIEFIAAAYSEYRRKLVSELSRFGGTDIDEIDEALVNELIKRLKRAGRLGKRIAHYDGTPWTGTPIWIDGAPNLLMWIRNQRFRPKLSEITAEAERLGMIPESAIVEGGIAEQRRQITAPAEYADKSRQIGATRALMGGVVLSLPPAPKRDEPSWLGMFPSRDDGGPLDVAMMTCLLHLSDGVAVETIRSINSDSQRRRDQIEQDNQRAESRRLTLERRRATSTDNPAVAMVEAWRRRQVPA